MTTTATPGLERLTLDAVKQAVGKCLAGLTHADVSPSARRKIEAAILATPSPAPAGGEVRALREALEPFRTFADHAVERADGSWVWSASSRDRICDWFGPTDFGGVVAAIASPAEAAQAGVDWRAARIREAQDEGDGFWRSCSGCHELNDGAPTGEYNTTFRTHTGVGCSECGGLGVIWDTTDYADMADFMLRDDATPSREEEPTDEQVERAKRVVERALLLHISPLVIRAALKAASPSAQQRVSEANQEKLAALVAQARQRMEWRSQRPDINSIDHERRSLCWQF